MTRLLAAGSSRGTAGGMVSAVGPPPVGDGKGLVVRVRAGRAACEAS